MELQFKMELPFRNGASISKWSFHFKIELRFQNRALISKSSFDFEMELRFPNGASISKSSFDFEMELQFRNRASIFIVVLSSIFIVSGFYRGQNSSLVDQRRERNGTWWNETISKGSETAV